MTKIRNQEKTIRGQRLGKMEEKKKKKEAHNLNSIAVMCSFKGLNSSVSQLGI